MNAPFRFSCALLIASLVACAQADNPLTVSPPPMPKRSIAPSPTPPPGASVVIHDGETRFTLFLPDGWKPAESATVTLTTHFHGVNWFIIQEHARRGSSNPLLSAQLGEGSSVYRKPFEDRERFGRWIRLVENALKEHGAPPDVRVGAVEVSSFSAGYGAVRELVKSPDYFKLIQRIVLCDSMYASLASTDGQPGRKPAPEHIEPWLPFARAAMRGEKTFVFTHSEIPTDSYASSAECAEAIIKALDAPVRNVESGSEPAASDPDFPLQRRSDAGNLHIWSYGGDDAQAHLTHIRHLADIWRALGR